MSESMKLFKRENGIYYVRISSQKRISLGTKDRREAEKLYREVKKQYHKGKLYILEGKKNIYLSEAIKDFLHYQSQVNTIKTAKTMRFAWQKRALTTIFLKMCRILLLKNQFQQRSWL